MAEVIAAWRAVELACRLDLRGIMLEGLRKNWSCWSLYGQDRQVVYETKMLGHH
ncbi:hypothetical protein FH972_002880 [Carpinus fangiana]|uniref:Uncharacterized protein n=1 Tax=Carpinus fangiana TaxID=176857 RepID=A0A5N6QG78_9ROSI|nr:hypothetical protein FH972_002880 [Carpinus fangiana]